MPGKEIRLRKGQRLRAELSNGLPVHPNESMMFHPIHLHGHTFRWCDPTGRMRTVEVDFDTVNPGKWITYRHNSYHLDAGMGTLITYS